MRHIVWGIVVAGLLAGPAAAQPAVTITKPWMRYLLPSLPAAGYMVVQNNGGSPVAITGASSSACGMLMLHESSDASGMAMMMDVPNVTVPAHGSVTFAPGGYHLMCMQPKMVVGQNVPVTVTLQGGAQVRTLMRVYGAQSQP
jgi:copper(I)-binding protein